MKLKIENHSKHNEYIKNNENANMSTNENNKIRHVQTFKTKATETKHGKRINKWKQVVKIERNTYNKKNKRMDKH